MGIKVKNETATDNGPADLIPAGTIAASKVTDLREKTISWKDKTTGEDRSADLVNWRFDITDGEYAGRSVYGSVDAYMSSNPRNRFRLWSETVLGREIPQGELFDTDVLLGLPVKVLIKHRPDKRDPSKVYVEVEELLPVGGGFSFSDEPPF